MINTLNESSLHKTLKTLYSQQNEESITECKIKNFIVDIETGKGDVIEIQTGTLSSLLGKVKYFSENKTKITIVFPIPCEKYIETHKKDGTITTRKSPIKKNIYNSFKELTKLSVFLLNKYVYLDVVESQIIEIRRETESEQQSKNKRRRFNKNWQKENKKLKSIINIIHFHEKESYLSIFPQDLHTQFTTTEFYNLLKKEKPEIKVTQDNIRLMFWVYEKMGLIRKGEKKGRSWLYSIRAT